MRRRAERNDCLVGLTNTKLRSSTSLLFHRFQQNGFNIHMEGSLWHLSNHICKRCAQDVHKGSKRPNMIGQLFEQMQNGLQAYTRTSVYKCSGQSISLQQGNRLCTYATNATRLPLTMGRFNKILKINNSR